MNQLSKLFLFFGLLLLSVGIGVSGCGDDEDDDPGEIISPGANNNSDAGLKDTLDPDATSPDIAQPDATAPDALDGDPDAESPDTNDDAGPSEPNPNALCDGHDFGVIGADQSVTTTADFSDAEDHLKLSCGGQDISELVFSFAVEQPSIVRIAPTSALVGAWRMQIHRGDCEDAARVVCYDRGDETVIVEPGQTYHVVLEPSQQLDDGAVELTLETEAIGCFPNTPARCEGDERVSCDQFFEEVIETCDLGCNDAHCAGDICAEPIEFSPDADGVMQLEMSIAGYTNQVNMRSRDECFDSGYIYSTEGRDLFVALNGVQAGQVVRVDTTDPGNDSMIFLLDGCGAQDACLSGQHTREFEWEVEEAGDYILLIDHISALTMDVRYQISVQ